ncbi:MobV family relaxase [Dendronalium sp. ChiSLP03b]|uniref:MobV family relaxase n=1 Tax=Dendronalium sp. ChiSLP03b TaxID=3075381 RepID=UPI002AD59473|nr:MobV family relaxase [Dendronalium sp. ChiSLP03b]MDZ8203512.1 MobV family relaxase [Dendronalium sp. ChiSLP03b]
MAYAIARLKKLKHSNLAGSASHTNRERETPNADPTKENIRFIGSLDPEERLEDLVLAKIAEHEQKRKIRTDGVYAVEFLLSASPSYFRPDCPNQAGYYDPQKLDDWLEATHQWLADEYGERIVRAELHLDEATPHIHAYFVPVDDEGQLRCNHFFDGRQKIQLFQDSYYDTMRLIGLERGLKGSRAQHQDIKDFYRIVESGRDLEYDDLNFEQLKAKAADRDRATRSKQEMETTALALARENELLQKRIAQLERDNQTLRQLASYSTDLPLVDVAWELGLHHHHERGAWKGYHHIINIDGKKFTDLDPGSPLEGNGAIDLVMHVNSCNTRQAIAWLYDRFGSALAERAALAQARQVASEIIQLEPRPNFQLPVEDRTNWQLVSNYLTQKRSIPPKFVELLHQRGLIYADDRQNAVFVMRNLEGIPQGAFLQGTQNNTFKGYLKGTKRRDSWFYFHLGKEPTAPAERLVLLKSPIDAISFAMLEYQVKGGLPPTRTLFLAVDSPKSLPVERLQNIPIVQVAFDGDDIGNANARAVKKLLPQAKRNKSKATDWNQELVNFSCKLQQHRYRLPQFHPELEL